jgi:cation diffusion facilitator CzcD-associated flavoprotein CzcO
VTDHETDYLVVGAGLAGLAFLDTLLDSSDATAVLVDRRHAPGGHWLDSYPFVRLHQASRLYGVASTPLGQERILAHGPAAGRYESASGTEICGCVSTSMLLISICSGLV